jgi:hypothetical protein
MRKVSKLLNQVHALHSHRIDFTNSDMPVDPVGQPLPIPHNEDAA